MYRKGTPNDQIAIYALICELENIELPWGRFTEIYQKQLTDDRYYCLVCEYDDHIIGILNLRFEDQLHHADRIAEIMEFIITAPCRGKGIGKKMFATACKIAKDFGCTQLELSSNQTRSSAHRFYEREGMRNSHFKFVKMI